MNLPSLAIRLTAAAGDQVISRSGDQHPELHRIRLESAVIPAFPALVLLATRPDVRLHYSSALLPCDWLTDWLKPARHYIPSVTDEHRAHIQKKVVIHKLKRSLNLGEPVDFKIAHLTYNINHVLLPDRIQPDVSGKTHKISSQVDLCLFKSKKKKNTKKTNKCQTNVHITFVGHDMTILQLIKQTQEISWKNKKLLGCFFFSILTIFHHSVLYCFAKRVVIISSGFSLFSQTWLFIFQVLFSWNLKQWYHKVDLN